MFRDNTIRPPLTFLRLPALLTRRGHGRSTAYRHVEDGLLTPPVRLGPNTAAWPEFEIEAIDRARLAGADDAAIRLLVRDLIAARSKVAA